MRGVCALAHARSVGREQAAAGTRADEALDPAPCCSAISFRGCEVIVADGGSADATRRVASRAGARVITSPRGRARQLNAGAAQASGGILVFLHADSALPAGWGQEVQGALDALPTTELTLPDVETRVMMMRASLIADDKWEEIGRYGGGGHGHSHGGGDAPAVSGGGADGGSGHGHSHGGKPCHGHGR